MKNIFNWIEENKQQFEGQEPRTMDQAALVDDLEPGSLKDELLNDFDPSQETYEEYLQRKRLGERPFNMAQGGSAGQLVTPSVDGSRPGYGGKQNISYNTENKIVKEYNKYLANEIKSGDLSKSLGFKSWLRENKTPAVFEKTYNAYTNNRLNVKPSKLTDAKIGLIKTMVDSANAQGKFVEKKKILKLIGRDTSPGLAEKNVYVDNVIKEINKLDTQEMKVHKAFNKLINNELVFVTDPDFYQKFPTAKLTDPGSMTRMLMAESGLGDTTVRKYRSTFKKPGSNVLYFSTKKGKQQLDIIKHMNLKMGKVGEEVFDGFSFNDLMEYGANSKKGKMYFKTATGSDFYKDPNNVVRDFAVKNFDNNAKWGNESKIQFYKKGSNTPIKWQPGKRITKDLEFTYEGKRYSDKDLAKEYRKWSKGEYTPFKEVYDNHRAYTNFLKRTVVVDGQKTTIGKLFKDAGHMGMAIDHNTLGGVGEEPFKNLRLLSSRANSELGTILQYYKKFPKIQKLLANEFTKHLPVNENYIDALAKNEIKIAKDMLKHGNSTIPMTYNQAAKNILTNKNIKNFSQKELLTVSKSAYAPEVGYERFKGMQPKVFEGVKTKAQLEKVLSNFWCGTGKAYGGRIGFASGSGCPAEVKQKNFLKMTNDVGKGRITGEAAEEIAKNAAKVVAKVGSKSALASILGPAGIGIDLAYEVGSIGFDMAMDSNVSLKQALQNNWLTGGFIKGTSQEEYNKGLVNFDSSAKPMATIQNLIEKIEREEKNLERMETSLVRGDYTGEAKKELLAKQEALIKNLHNDFDKVARKKATSPGHPEGEQVKYLALEEGSPERIAFDRAKQEYDSIGEAKALLKKPSKHGFEESLKTSRAEPWIDFSLSINPKYGKYSKKELDKRLKEFGDYFGYGWTPYGLGYGMQQMQPGIGDMKYNENLGYREVADALMMSDAWDNLSKGAPNMADGGRAGYMGGGITGIRKPSAIPPKRQGLRSIMINVNDD